MRSKHLVSGVPCSHVGTSQFENDSMINRRAFDDFSEAGFSVNQFGTIRSDFSDLINSQDMLAFQRAYQRVQEIRANEPDNSHKTIDEIIREIRPRWVQSPTQLLAWEDWLAKNKVDEYQRQLDEARREQAERVEAEAAAAAASAAAPAGGSAPASAT